MKRVYVLVIYVLTSLCLMSCDNKQTDSSNTSKALVVCTTSMLGDAVKQVVGGRANVKTLMGVGVDPHLYKATPSDLDKLTQADIIFYNGLHLEGKMIDVLKKLKKQKLVWAVSQDIPHAQLRKVKSGAIDPHIWFDVRLWKKVIQTIGEKMQTYDTLNATFYKKNTSLYTTQLDSLNTEIRTMIGKIPENKRVLVTSHDAFGYFGRAYGIQVKGLQGISTLSEAGLRDITNLVEFIMEKKINAVFVETSVSEKDINAVVEGCRKQGYDLKIGGRLYGDAMGEKGTPAGTYIGMLQTNTYTIFKALTGDVD